MTAASLWLAVVTAVPVFYPAKRAGNGKKADQVIEW